MNAPLTIAAFARLASQAPRIAASVRAITGEPILANSSGRMVRYLFSDTSVGRDQHTISGWQLDNFRRNPVFLFAHDASSPPIGRIADIQDSAGKLTGSVEYIERDVYPFADMIFQLVRGGYINAVSTSWNPIEWKFSTDRARPGGIDFKLVDLLEISQVPVPALPTALATARSAGIDTSPMIEWTEKTLDEGSNVMARDHLSALRRAAGATSKSFQFNTPASRRARAEMIRGDSVGSFQSLGEQLQAIAYAGAEGVSKIDRRLVRAPLGMSEGDPTSGGFLVETQYAQDLVGIAYEEAVLAPLCDRRATSRPLADVKLPAVDETSRADGSRWGGVLSYWVGEADLVNAVFPKWRNLSFSAKKLIGLCVVSNELLGDAPMLEAHISRAFGAEFGFKLDLAALAGTGAGQPQGILASPALITIAKETGQAAGTILDENVRNMWKRLPAPSRKRAVWFVNEDAEDKLENMMTVVGGGASPAANALYMPAGTGGNPFPLLKGRPVHVMEQCSALGTLGDIVLADPSHYIIIDGGITPALSVHVRFVNDEAVFRFVLRIDGLSAFASPITPYNGSSTRSPFVALAAR